MFEYSEEIISFIFLIIFGSIISYEDIKIHKIRNKYILLLLFFAFAINIKNLFVGPAYFLSMLTNIIIAFLAGFLLWHFHFWTAGDAKLYLAFSALIPLSVYTYRHIIIFPAFDLMINTFILIFIALLSNLMIKTDLQEKIHILKNTLNLKFLVTTFLFLFGFLWLITSVLSLFNIQSNFLIIALVLIFILFFLGQKFKSHLIKISIVLTIFRIFFDIKSILNFNFVLQFILSYIFFVFIFGFLSNLGSFMFINPVKINDLRTGMVPLEAVVKEKNKKTKKYRKIFYSFFNIYDDKKYEFLIKSPRGLMDKQIERLKRLYKEKKLNFDSLLIQQTMPFAPFLFMGAILTYLFSGSAIIFFKILLMSLMKSF